MSAFRAEIQFVALHLPVNSSSVGNRAKIFNPASSLSRPNLPTVSWQLSTSPSPQLSQPPMLPRTLFCYLLTDCTSTVLLTDRSPFLASHERKHGVRHTWTPHLQRPKNSSISPKASPARHHTPPSSRLYLALPPILNQRNTVPS